MCARLANAERELQPRLVDSVGGVVQPTNGAAPMLPFDPAHIQFVRAAMAAVTTTGTAAGVADLGLGPIKMAGKTGTAQTHSYHGGIGAHGAVGAWDLRDNSWFIAFAPYDDPRYAMSVLVEHGGFGAEAAAPRAREIMRVALLKDPEVRARIEQPLPPTPPPAPSASTSGGSSPPPVSNAASNAASAAT
ncbi:MAG: penicillin-binding transpeptidase domain-containing protein, partial [Caulobacteraceae bacterium]